jgi:hypothetical protein
MLLKYFTENQTASLQSVKFITKLKYLINQLQSYVSELFWREWRHYVTVLNTYIVLEHLSREAKL